MDTVTWLLFGAGVALFIFVAYLLAGGLPYGAVYEPIPGRKLRRMIEMSGLKEGMVGYDLGSGFGRILFEGAKTGAVMVGVEIDPVKCWWTERQAKKKGLGRLVKVIHGNILDTNLSTADVVFLFLLFPIMDRLKRKLMAEMKSGSIVISYDHKFNDWEPSETDKKNRMYLYRMGNGAGLNQPAGGV